MAYVKMLKPIELHDIDWGSSPKGKSKLPPSKVTYGYIRTWDSPIAKEVYSLDNQTKKIKVFADLEDLNVIRVFVDNCSSKTLFGERPALKELLTTIKADETLLMYDLSRIMGCPQDYFNLFTDSKKRHYHLQTVTKDLSTRTPIGKFMALTLYNVIIFNHNTMVASTEDDHEETTSEFQTRCQAAALTLDEL